MLNIVFMVIPSLIGLIGTNNEFLVAPTHQGEYPFVVSIMLKPDEHRCSGILISRNWILTVCDCIKTTSGITLPKEDLKVVAGVVDLSNPHQERGVRQVRNISRIIPHNGCIYRAMKDNVVLLSIAKPFVLTKNVSLTQIPGEKREDKDNNADKNCCIIGWGFSNSYAENKNTKLQAKMSYVSQSSSHCKQLRGMDYTDRKELECHKINWKHVIECTSDAGGPVLCGPSETLTGLVLFKPLWIKDPSLQCPWIYPGITLKLHPYYQWISSHTHSKHSVCLPSAFVTVLLLTVLLRIS